MPPRVAQSVANNVRKQILAEKLRPGDYVASERKLSELLNVSRMTARRGLEMLVNEGLLARRPGKGYVLCAPGKNGATVDDAVRALLFLHTHTGDRDLTGDPIHAEIWAGAREEASKTDRLVLVSAIEGDHLSPDRATELSRVCAGVLCDQPDPATHQLLREAGLTVVLVHAHAGVSDLDNVVQDDFGGMVTIVDHLVKRRHDRIGYLDTTASLMAERHHFHAERRWSGYLAGLRRAELKVNPQYVAEADFRDPEDAAPALALLKADVSALIVPHKELLPGIEKAFEQSGKTPGKDVTLAIWGDPPEAGDSAWGKAAYLCYDKRQLGREGVRRLLFRMENPDAGRATVTVRCEIIER